MSSATTDASTDNTLWLKFASFMVKCVIVVFCMISGWANVQTWTENKEGLDYLTFAGAGVGIEVFALFMLLFMEKHLSACTLRSTLKAIISFVLWGGAVYFSATASWDFYVDRDTAKQQQALIAADNLKFGLAETRIEEVTNELEFIGLTRTPEEIIAERDRLPENYITKRAQLNSELAKAKRRQDLNAELSNNRDILLGSKAISISKSVANDTVTVEQKQDGLLGFWNKLRDNHWAALVVFMELVKAIGFFLIRTEEPKTFKSKKPKKAMPKSVPAAKPQLVVSNQEEQQSPAIDDGLVEISIGGKSRRVKPV